MLEKQPMPFNQLTVNPHTLMVYFEELCESVLNVPFSAAEEKRESHSAVTSCVSTIDINRNQSCLLTICCDDDLLDAVLVKMAPCATLNLKMKSTLTILNELTTAISGGLVSIFKNQFYLGLLSPPIWLDDGIIAEGTLEHRCGCVHILLTNLDPIYKKFQMED